VEDFSSPDGLIEHDLLQRIFWFTRLSLFHPGLGAWFFYGVFGLACLGAWGIVLGYHVKVCAAVLYVIAVSTYRWNFLVMYVDDAIMHLLLFWLLVLPIGKTLVLGEWRHQSRDCMARWRQVTVPGTSLRCFLANVALVYLVAGLWKFESPLWREGFAVYATLRLPISYAPDFWGPQHLLWLWVMNHLALLIEPLLPVLLGLRRGHPLKWFGLFAQLGFHISIIATLRIPFANLALMATAVLFFREEIMRVCWRGQQEPIALGQTVRIEPSGWLALAFLLVLSLAMMRRLPWVGEVHKPAYALLWVVGIAQDYQLFNWVDRKNYHAKYDAMIQLADGQPRPLDPDVIFSTSLRATLLQSYLHDVRWIRVPYQYRYVLKQSVLLRIAQRFCRLHHIQGQITVWSTVQRIHPANASLTRGKKRFLMTFACIGEHVELCDTFLKRNPSRECRVSPQRSPHTPRVQ
jgi:hypothetical protein